jgi:hypothetical protein
LVNDNGEEKRWMEYKNEKKFGEEIERSKVRK